jgi:hypothetical protein
MSGEWEELIDLRLQFGGICGQQIEVFAEGLGAVESTPDVFPSGEVSFEVQTTALFRGVGVCVPLNSNDPLAYAMAKVRALLPRYNFVSPVLRRTCDDEGNVRAVEVLLAPDGIPKSA